MHSYVIFNCKRVEITDDIVASSRVEQMLLLEPVKLNESYRFVYVSGVCCRKMHEPCKIIGPIYARPPVINRREISSLRFHSA